MRAAARSLLLAAVWAAGVGAAPPEAAGLFRVWVPQAAAASVEPLPLRSSLTREGSVPGAAPGEAQRAASVSCGPPGMPAILQTAQPVELVDGGDRVVMRFAEWNAERVVYLRPGNGPPSGQRSPLGASFGRWEGRTLAIFTLYIDYAFFDARGTPQSKDVTVLERYTPSAGGERLDYRVTVTDDATFTRPVVREGFMTPDSAATLEGLVAKDCVG